MLVVSSGSRSSSFVLVPSHFLPLPLVCADGVVPLAVPLVRGQIVPFAVAGEREVDVASSVVLEALFVNADRSGVVCLPVKPAFDLADGGEVETGSRPAIN